MKYIYIYSMGNITSIQNVGLNLNENLLPQIYFNQFIELIINDILNNISQGVSNIIGFTITKLLLETYINNLDLYSQFVNSISTIIAQNIKSSTIIQLVTNAMNNNTGSNLSDFQNSVSTIISNINYDLQIVTNEKLLNLIENIVQDNLDIISIKKCFISHTINFIDTTKIDTPTASTVFQTSISSCTEISSELNIIIKNLLNKLDIKITAINTIKTGAQYLQEFQTQFNSLQIQYNAYDSEITSSGFSIYNDDKDNLHKLHELVIKMENIQQEMENISNKISILEEQPFLTPEELTELITPIPQKEDLDVSGKKNYIANNVRMQQKIQNLNKQQISNNKLNLNNNLTKKININANSNFKYKLNTVITKTNIQDKDSKINISTKVKKFIYICTTILMVISCLIASFYYWRVKSAASMLGKASKVTKFVKVNNENN